MEEDREIIDNIYNRLPIEVTNENENQNLNRRIRYGRIGGTAGGGILGGIVGGIVAIGGTYLAIPLFFIPVIGPFMDAVVSYGPFIAVGLVLLLGSTIADNRCISIIQ